MASISVLQIFHNRSIPFNTMLSRISPVERWAVFLTWASVPSLLANFTATAWKPPKGHLAEYSSRWVAECFVSFELLMNSSQRCFVLPLSNKTSLIRLVVLAMKRMVGYWEIPGHYFIFPYQQTEIFEFYIVIIWMAVKFHTGTSWAGINIWIFCRCVWNWTGRIMKQEKVVSSLIMKTLQTVKENLLPQEV